MSTLIENINRIYTDKEAIKQVIVAKGITVPDRTSLDEYAGLIAQINSGMDTGDATAIATDIMNGKTAYIKGKKVTGSMANQGAINHSLSINGSYTIPEGYHNGIGKVTQSINSKAAEIYVPTTTDQIIAANQYLSGSQTIRGDENLIPDNIISGKSIFGINGTANSSGESIFYTTLVCKLYPSTTNLNQNIRAQNTYSFNIKNAKKITFENIVFSQISGSFLGYYCSYQFTYIDNSKSEWTEIYTSHNTSGVKTTDIDTNIKTIDISISAYGGISSTDGFLRTTMDIKIEY